MFTFLQHVHAEKTFSMAMHKYLRHGHLGMNSMGILHVLHATCSMDMHQHSVTDKNEIVELYASWICSMAYSIDLLHIEKCNHVYNVLNE
jgi:hypothetical protein